MAKVPRGIRNNNPGNIRKGVKWDGLADPKKMTSEQKVEKEFDVFSSSEMGIRALAKLLVTYKKKHKLNTISGIVTRYAPKEDKNNTDAYIAAVSARTGIGPKAVVDVEDHGQAKNLISAIIHVENGMNPYPDTMIDKGLGLAGIKKAAGNTEANTKSASKGSATP